MYSKKLPDDTLVPSHSELYRDFHRIELALLMYIFYTRGFRFFGRKRRGGSRDTEFDLRFEDSEGWDIVYKLKYTPEEKLTHRWKNDDQEMRFLFGDRWAGEKEGESFSDVSIEYKSSIEEWGKQFDAYLRQMNKRRGGGLRVLVSFDERFEDYQHAAQRSGFGILVLPKVLLKMLAEKDADKAQLLYDEFLKLFPDLLEKISTPLEG